MVILKKVFGLVDGDINGMAREKALGLLSGSRGVSVSWQRTLDFLEAEVENLSYKKPKSPNIVHKKTLMGLRVSGLWETQLGKPAGSGSWKLMRLGTVSKTLKGNLGWQCLCQPLYFFLPY